MGLPVLTTNVSGAEELAENGKTGFVTPVGDLDSFVRALKSLLSNDQLMQEMGERNKRKGNMFKLDIIVNQWEQVIKRVVYEK